DRVATTVPPSPPRAEDGDVVAFGAARGEADFVGRRAQALCDSLASLVQRRPRLTAPLVNARWVPEAGAEKRHHRLENFGAHGRRRGVVEVNGIRHSPKYRRGKKEAGGGRRSAPMPASRARRVAFLPTRAPGRTSDRSSASDNGNRAFRRFRPSPVQSPARRVGHG